MENNQPTIEQAPLAQPDTPETTQPEKVDELDAMNQIQGMLRGVNFAGIGMKTKNDMTSEMLKVVVEKGLNKDEIAKFVKGVQDGLDKMSKYVEQFPPVEVAQAVASLLMFKKMDYLMTHIHREDAEKFALTLPEIAEKIKSERAGN